MLNGGGGLNADGLALDLQFAADKTLTARRGPTPVLIRSSGDNGGTTYFGPLVDFDLLNEIAAIGITNGRASWFKSDGTNDITISYTGTRWRVIVAHDGIEDEYLAAPGSEWRPDQADWSGQDFSVTTSSSFGIVKAANNEPRFDHDPTSPFACRGLLIEEGRTNLLQHSSNFKDTTSSSYWQNMTATTVTVDQTTSPDGGVNADLLTTSATAFDCFTRRSGVYAAASTQYTYSIFVKRGPSNYRYVGFYVGAGTGGAAQFPYFDFDNPTIVQLPTITYGTINSTRVDPYPNGWYRISITFTTGATTPSTFAGVFISSSTGAAQSTNPAGNDCYIWGIQSELGSFPTSYIPTTTGTLARSADVCSITGGDFNGLYNQSEGTLLLNADEFRRGVSFPALLRIENSASPSANRISIGSYGTKNGNPVPLELLVTSGGTVQYSVVQTSTPSNFKAALAYKLDDVRAALNGALTAADTPPSVSPIGANTLRIGGDGIHISSVRYYRKRLPDAKLQALTV